MDMEGGGSNTPFYRGTNPSAAASVACSQQNGAQKRDRGYAIDAEIGRVNNLPAHSSYAIHRMKVLNKLRHLMSIKVHAAFSGFRILLLATKREAVYKNISPVGTSS